MQKHQTVTNRKQKASSAVTPKASHLTVISNTGNRPMNNSTATNFNNQDIILIVNEAKRTAELINKSASALKSIGKVISIDITNKCTNNDNYSFLILDGLTDAIELIADNLDYNGNELGNSLIRGGYVNE